MSTEVPRAVSEFEPQDFRADNSQEPAKRQDHKYRKIHNGIKNLLPRFPVDPVILVDNFFPDLSLPPRKETKDLDMDWLEFYCTPEERLEPRYKERFKEFYHQCTELGVRGALPFVYNSAQGLVLSAIAIGGLEHLKNVPPGVTVACVSTAFLANIAISYKLIRRGDHPVNILSTLGCRYIDGTKDPGSNGRGKFESVSIIAASTTEKLFFEFSKLALIPIAPEVYNGLTLVIASLVSTEAIGNNLIFLLRKPQEESVNGQDPDVSLVENAQLTSFDPASL